MFEVNHYGQLLYINEFSDGMVIAYGYEVYLFETFNAIDELKDYVI